MAIDPDRQECSDHVGKNATLDDSYIPSVAQHIHELIGSTPVLRYPLASPISGYLLMKLESRNVGHSMKDRMALAMIQSAEQSGRLRAGGTIVESSSGNTAASLAMLAAARGYRFIAVVDQSAASEKGAVVRAFGGEVVQVVSARGTAEERNRVAKDLADSLPDAVWTDQANNVANPDGYRGLARELLAGVPDLDVLIGAIGTGGTLVGTARHLRRANHEVRVVAVEPEGSTYFAPTGHSFLQSGTGNPPGGSVPDNLDFELVDEHTYVADAAAFTTCRYLAQRLGLLVGGSSGGLIYAALRLVDRRPASRAVVLVLDSGERYLSTIYSDRWLEERGLLDEEAWDRLERWTRAVPGAISRRR